MSELRKDLLLPRDLSTGHTSPHFDVLGGADIAFYLCAAPPQASEQVVAQGRKTRG